jgi:hypothetical protein
MIWGEGRGGRGELERKREEEKCGRRVEDMGEKLPRKLRRLLGKERLE